MLVDDRWHPYCPLPDCVLMRFFIPTFTPLVFFIHQVLRAYLLLRRDMFKFGSSGTPKTATTGSSGSAAAKASAEAMYDKLLASAAPSQSDPDALSAPHLVSLAEMIGIHEDDILLYIIVWKLQAKSKPCHITRDEFVSGMQQMRLDSFDKLKAAIPALRREIQSPNNFRDFYYFVFDWLRESPQSRSIPNDTACVMWPLLLTTAQFPNLDHWLKFIQEVYKKAVGKDLWQQTLAFSQVPLESYDPNGSWPSAMDEFVTWMKNGGGQKK